MNLTAGIRHNRQIYVAYEFDPDNGDMYVTLELINNEGTLMVATGQVVWGEGE